MKKKLIAIGLLFMIAFAGAGCVENETHEKGIERIERISKIELPEEIEIEYHYYHRAPQGDLKQYTVIKLNEYPTNFLQENSFSNTTGQILYLYVTFIASVVPKEFRPDWESEYLSIQFTVYDSNSGGAMLYFPENNRLIIIMTN